MKISAEAYIFYLFSVSLLSFLGSIFGGTRVRIDGDGFSQNNTRLFIASIEYTSFIIVSYSQIILTTPSQLMYQDLNLNMIIVTGNNMAVCLAPTCQYCWATNSTPYLLSASTSTNQNLTTFTLVGQNFFGGGGTVTSTHVNINNHYCNITLMTNQSIVCSASHVEAGTHDMFISIEGL